jgi:hypothetical protein
LLPAPLFLLIFQSFSYPAAGHSQGKMGNGSVTVNDIKPKDQGNFKPAAGDSTPEPYGSFQRL